MSRASQEVPKIETIGVHVEDEQLSNEHQQDVPEEYPAPGEDWCTEFPHLSAEVRELAKALAKTTYTAGQLKYVVRMARVLDGMRRVEWQPNFAGLSRATGMKTITIWDHYQRLRDRGMCVEIKIGVPPGPVLTIAPLA